jgi:hypothetical protein
VQGEWICIGAKLDNEKGHTLAHEPADEVNVTREPVQLRDYDWASLALPARLNQRRRELRPAFERIGALAALGLDEFGRDLEVLSLGESLDCLALRFQTETASGLPARADAKVTYKFSAYHGSYTRYAMNVEELV